MSQITCNTIADLLELYSDGVVSEDTKTLVAEHLRECVKCSEKLALIKQSLSIPTETSVEPIKQIKRKIIKRNILVALLSVFIFVPTVLICMGAFVQSKVTIPYEETQIYSVELNDNEILVKFADNIEEYSVYCKYFDDATMEVYIYFINSNYERHFSNPINISSYISVPAHEGVRLNPTDEKLTDCETIRVYYCVFSKLPANGKIDLSDKHLIWEKETD